MKPKSIVVLAACFAAGAGVWCWWLLTMKADGTRVVAGVPAGPKLENRIVEPLPKVEWPEYGSPEFQRLARERSVAWLDTRGRDAAGLIAIWDLTGDDALLKEAAEKFPNDPRVCMAMIGHLQAKRGPELLPWVERLLAAEPKNPAGYHLKAWVLRSGIDKAGALAALTEAGKCSGGRNIHAVERAGTVRAAAMAAGMSPAQAARVAVGTPFDRMLDCRVGGSVNRVILDEVEKVRKANDDTRLMEMTGLGLTLAESMTGGTVTGDRFAGELKLRLLADLPGDAEIGAGGRRAGSLRAEVEDRQLYVNQANRHSAEVTERFRTKNEEWAVTYADCVLSHGETTARLSMLDLPEPDEEKAGTN